MNIFILDKNPAIAAKYHCDKHVVKMILESAQLLSTAHRVLDGTEGIRLSATGRKLKDWKLSNPEMDQTLYKATHINHPCAIWARENSSNYIWLLMLSFELCKEYTSRYTKTHKTENIIKQYLKDLPKNIKIAKLMTDFPQAMPDYCKAPGDPVAAYRNYYIAEKEDIAVWAHSETPEWFKNREITVTN